MGTKKEKEKTNEDKPLVGKTIITKSDETKLNCQVLKLKKEDKHKVTDESENAVVTNKSKGAWVSKEHFKL